MEKIFSDAFSCEDLSRSDITIDVKKDNVGIGLKTFLHHKNGSYQKVAEFNKASYLLRDIEDDLSLITTVAELRNKRMDFAISSQGLSDTLYHVITRDSHKLYLYEEEMSFIDLESIVIDNVKKYTILFHDKNKDYSFSISKNTLMMKFLPIKDLLVGTIPVEIIDNPLDILGKIEKETTSKLIAGLDYIVLPLFSDQSGRVEEKSGLNMWNGGGRLRNQDEVYITIPIWVHRKTKGFFPYKQASFNSESFKVKLPNGTFQDMKVTQTNGKALQSNPNKALGKWILRDILKLPSNTIVTKNMLDEIGIDSVQLTKLGNDDYKLDFLPSDSYYDFKKLLL